MNRHPKPIFSLAGHALFFDRSTQDTPCCLWHRSYLHHQVMIGNNLLTPIIFQTVEMDDSVLCANTPTALVSPSPLFMLCHLFVLLFISSTLYWYAHAVTSAAFAAVQLGADGNQLLLAWIAMRIPFPIGAPVHSLLYTHPWYYLIIPSQDIFLPTLPLTHPSGSGRRRCCQPMCRHRSSCRQR